MKPEPIEIENLGDLRDFNVAQISYSLFKHHSFDPEIAICSGWWVFHNNEPKNWAQYMSLIGTLQLKIKKFPVLKERWVEAMLINYKNNTFAGYPTSLLPTKPVR